MQSIIFTNSKGENITFARGFPYLLQSIEGIGTAESNPLSYRGFMQDGVSFLSTLLEPREIILSLWIKGSSREDLLARRQNVIKVFNPKMDEGELTYTNDYGSWKISGVVKNVLQGEIIRNTFVQNLEVTMFCADPIWSDASAGAQTMTLSAFSGGLAFPFSAYDAANLTDAPLVFGEKGGTAVVINNGNTDSPILIEFKGPGSRHRLVNKDTNQKIELAIDLKGDESVFVSTKPQNIQVYRMVNGVKLTAFNYLKPESEFFTLQTGENNIEFSAAHGEATATVTYTERYVGV